MYTFEPAVVPAWGKAVINTKITIGLPPGTYGRIASRSGLSLNNDLEVGAGVVDNGYTGEIKVIIRNFSDTPYTFAAGNKIAQLIIEKYIQCPIKEVENLQDVMKPSTRGANGFGSSGK